ncbi:uncharacterized protein PHA67_011907 [Liasis olivaceus]
MSISLTPIETNKSSREDSNRISGLYIPIQAQEALNGRAAAVAFATAAAQGPWLNRSGYIVGAVACKETCKHRLEVAGRSWQSSQEARPPLLRLQEGHRELRESGSPLPASPPAPAATERLLGALAASLPPGKLHIPSPIPPPAPEKHKRRGASQRAPPASPPPSQEARAAAAPLLQPLPRLAGTGVSAHPALSQTHFERLWEAGMSCGGTTGRSERASANLGGGVQPDPGSCTPVCAEGKSHGLDSFRGGLSAQIY